MQPTVNIRTITVNDIKYTRSEDVANLLREIAATEETPVRERLEFLAGQFDKPA